MVGQVPTGAEHVNSDTVFVKILDKEYQVACQPEERDALVRAALQLDERMRKIRQSGSVIGLERIAVMAGLNLSHELLQTQNSVVSRVQDEDALRSLSDKLNNALDRLST